MKKVFKLHFSSYIIHLFDVWHLHLHPHSISTSTFMSTIIFFHFRFEFLPVCTFTLGLLLYQGEYCQQNFWCSWQICSWRSRFLGSDPVRLQIYSVTLTVMLEDARLHLALTMLKTEMQRIRVKTCFYELTQHYFDHSQKANVFCNGKWSPRKQTLLNTPAVELPIKGQFLFFVASQMESSQRCLQ